MKSWKPVELNEIDVELLKNGRKDLSVHSVCVRIMGKFPKIRKYFT